MATGKKKTAIPHTKSRSLKPDIAQPLLASESVPPAVNPSAPPPFPIVGIGASAGGLAAFQAFFSGMPDDKNADMAFVLIQHLDPDHKSLLTGLIKHCTRMEVFEVEDGMVVRPNCTYIIPPNREMVYYDGTLQLLEPSASRGHRLPINIFFRSLALGQHEHAIGIVLSGTGSDGTAGIRAIKGEGGTVLVQNPDSSEYDGMPRSAIATGLADFILLPAEMPGRLIGYVAHAYGKLKHIPETPSSEIENTLKKIFYLLRDQTGHDFSQYKPGTINRRIERRMAVNQICRMVEYLKFLQNSPEEIEALFRDLPIGVTSFFRDSDAFKMLEDKVLPGLLANMSPRQVIRVWSVGCSTGEEAYSIAMLLADRQKQMKQRFQVQIFATDLDSQAIATARAGHFPATIVQDIPAKHLESYFVAETDGNSYRVHKEIREMIVFSEHDLIKGPPFSRLDLIVCRNLLIYLNADLQKKLIPLFHYALNPGGVLFLGNSETIGESDDLFLTLDRKLKFYKRKEDLHNPKHPKVSPFFPALTSSGTSSSKNSGKTPARLMAPLRDLTEKALLRHFSAVAILVKGQGDILYLHGRSGMYLEPAEGESGVENILKMARAGLRDKLILALHKTIATGEVAYFPGLQVKTNGDSIRCNLTVRTISAEALVSDETVVYLVIIEEAAAAASPGHRGSSRKTASKPDPETEDTILALKQELKLNEEYLRSAAEELEISNEELKSANAEMRSVNEELHSTNEELETSQEELQSVNEELNTINAELQANVLELSNANNDMNNLLSGTGIGTVFVDRHLHILRFTSAVTQIINLIISDIGRPVEHIVSNLVGYDNLVADTQSVLDTLIPLELDVQTKEGKWYSLRIQPYRTLNNSIEGAVITFFNITEIVSARETLRKANDLLRLAVVVRDSHDAITVQDMSGRILAWNPRAEQMYGWSEAEALSMNDHDRIPEDLRNESIALLNQLSRSKNLEAYHTQRLAKDGSMVDIVMTATPLMNEAGQIYAVATTERRPD